MKKIYIITVMLMLAVAYNTQAQDTVYYHVSFPNIAHHEAKVEVQYSDLVKDEPLQLRMSLSSPGRYALHQFGKNVYHVKAGNNKDSLLSVERVEPEMWEVKGHGGKAKVEYTIFANYGDGTYAGIDRSYVHFNMPAVFMWARGMEKHPIKLTIDLPDSDWQVATQLVKAGKGYAARDFQYFMDSPVIMGKLSVNSFVVEEKGGRKKGVSVALSPKVDSALAVDYTALVEKVVKEEQQVYGMLPDYDYGKYVFLCSYAPWFHGDGMEHRNSTMITSSSFLEGNQEQLIRTVAHEFFHCWNVERIRPKALEPFNFETTNMSGELWFAEGFTSYYTELSLVRAGVYDVNSFGERIGRLLNYVINSGGTGISSPVEMSKQAAFVDAATAVDEPNFVNTFTSYYPYGAVIGLALDMELRAKFKDISLDDLMREMWKKHGQTEVPYTNADIQKALSTITNDEVFASNFFKKYIYGTTLPDYATLLNELGYNLEHVKPQHASIGRVNLGFSEEGIKVKSIPSRKTPIYQAGIDESDVIITVAGDKITTEEGLNKLLESHKPGDSIEVTYTHFGEEYSTNVVLQEDSALTVKPLGDVSRKVEKKRSQWIDSKVK